MGGVLVLVAFGIYGWILFRVMRSPRSVLFKSIAVGFLLTAPLLDAVYGRIKLKELCISEGGLKVTSTAQAEGIYRTDWPPDVSWLHEHKFAFMEGDDILDGRRVITRLTRSSSGHVTLEKDVQPKSSFRLRVVRGSIDDTYMRDDMIIETIDGKQELGRMTDFNYAGGWIERAVAKVYGGRGSAGTCGLSPNVLKVQSELVVATLRPRAY